MSAPQQRLGVVGIRQGAGELAVITGPSALARARLIRGLLKALPPAARFSILAWPHDHTRWSIERDLRDGLFVFAHVLRDDLELFPVKPYRLYAPERKVAA